MPCFPVTVETEGPRFSVAEALRRYRPIGGKPAPGGPPTTAEMQEQLTGAPRSDTGGVSFDPGCAMKSLTRMIRGSSNTFYLYRIQDSRGTRPLLLDRKLSREALDARPEVRELLGEFSGECEAIAAWRKAVARARASEQAVAAGRRAGEPAHAGADAGSGAGRTSDPPLAREAAQATASVGCGSRKRTSPPQRRSTRKPGANGNGPGPKWVWIAT